MHSARSLGIGLAATLCLLTGVVAQRGRGRSEAILERVSCYLSTAKLPAAVQGQDRLLNIPLVADAKSKKELALLYLYDSSADAPKRETFETVMFTNEEVGVATRCFHFARVDLAGETELLAKYGHRLPVFVAFDAAGKLSADVAFTGYRAAVGPLITLLEKASAGHVKPAIATFTSEYRSLVHDFEVLEGKRKAVQDRMARTPDDKKRVPLQKELDETDAEQKKLEAKEKVLLENAKVPVRAPGAKRFEVKGGR